MSPERIYLIGFMGAGKTTVGKILADRLQWTFIDLDEEIQRGELQSIPEIFAVHGEPHFRVLERQYLERVSMRNRAVIALGGGAFVSAENRALAESTGLTVWLKVSFAKVAERVKMDGTRPMFGSRQQAEDLYDIRESSYRLAKTHIATDDKTPETVAEEILGVIQNA
jgi:shikimate kinase